MALDPGYDPNYKLKPEQPLRFKQVTSNDELIPGNYYWVQNKERKGSFFPCYVTEHSPIGSADIPRKAIIINEMDFWAYEGNSQALARYNIFGPIPFPVVE